MDELFISTKIKSSLSIEPKDLNSNLNKKIIKKIKLDVEGKCIKNGYVKKNSVKLIKRSLGQSLTSHFNGNVIFHVEYLVDLCNPLEGATIECSVINSNKMGILAGMVGVEESPLNILLAKQHHIDNAEFEDLRERDIIKIRVLGKRYEFGDSQITIIGLLESEYLKQYNETLEDNDDNEEPLEVMSNNESQSQSQNSLSFEDNSNENKNPDPEALDNDPNALVPEALDKDPNALVPEALDKDPNPLVPEALDNDPNALDKDPEALDINQNQNQNTQEEVKVGEGKNDLDLDFELKPVSL